MFRLTVTAGINTFERAINIPPTANAAIAFKFAFALDKSFPKRGQKKRVKGVQGGED